jgi:hypothetical protein
MKTSFFAVLSLACAIKAQNFGSSVDAMLSEQSQDLFGFGKPVEIPADESNYVPREVSSTSTSTGSLAAAEKKLLISARARLHTTGS